MNQTSGEVDLFTFQQPSSKKKKAARTKSTDNGKRVTNVSKPKHLEPASLKPVLADSTKKY